MSAKDAGYVRVWSRDDTGAAFMVHRDDGPRLTQAWKAGEAFYDARDLFGDPRIVKLGTIGVTDLVTPAGIEQAKAEAAEEKVTDLTA